MYRMRGGYCDSEATEPFFNIREGAVAKRNGAARVWVLGGRGKRFSCDLPVSARTQTADMCSTQAPGIHINNVAPHACTPHGRRRSIRMRQRGHGKVNWKTRPTNAESRLGLILSALWAFPALSMHSPPPERNSTHIWGLFQLCRVYISAT